jgi:type IV pilus assembly protein PilW
MNLRLQRGQTLISIMIGLLVSFAVTLGVYSTLSVFEANRREMMGGDASIENAVATLSEIQWGIKHAGSGIMQSGVLNCPTINIYHDGDVIADSAPLAPVFITDGGASGSDRVTVGYGSSLFGPMRNQIIDQMPSPSSIFNANTGVGLNVGDLALIGLPGSTLPCTLFQITQIQVTGQGTNIQHNPGVSAPWNPPQPEHEFTVAPAYPPGSTILKIGQLRWHTYRIVNNRLELYDIINDTTDVLAEHVVGLRAWYGTSDGTNKNIEQWVAATGAWTTPTPAQIAATRAVQLAVAVRNPNHIKTTRADGVCDATTVSTLETWDGGPTFDLSASGADWQCFKYRVLTLVVPLRNVIYGETT